MCFSPGVSGGTEQSLARVVPLGPASAGALFWRSGPELQLTLVVQARFRMEHDRAMTVLEPLPLAVVDLHHEGDATRSLSHAADVVPFRPRTDVWMTGHAVAPGGLPTAAMAVRLAIYRSGVPLLDKVVTVLGDRAQAGAVPQPFLQMPLVYERAQGGAGVDANPVGCGRDELGRLPNVLDPVRAAVPAGFGPVSRYWKSRRQYLSSEQRRDLQRPVPVVGSGFDWRFFQAAPADQQLDGMVGDEWIVLDGVDAQRPRLQSFFPSIQAVARLFWGPAGVDELVALGIDTVAICADTKEVRVTWRGLVKLTSLEELAVLRVAAGVELAGVPTDWNEVERRLGGETPLVGTLPASVAAALGVRDEEFDSEDVLEELGRTDAEFAAAAGVREGGAEGSSEPTMRSRGVSRESSPADELLFGETLKNVDLGAIRQSLRASRTWVSPGNGGAELEQASDAVGERTLSTVEFDTLTFDAGGVGDTSEESSADTSGDTSGDTLADDEA